MGFFVVVVAWSWVVSLAYRHGGNEAEHDVSIFSNRILIFPFFIKNTPMIFRSKEPGDMLEGAKKLTCLYFKTALLNMCTFFQMESSKCLICSLHNFCKAQLLKEIRAEVEENVHVVFKISIQQKPGYFI
jgi:hypothetical protein